MQNVAATSLERDPVTGHILVHGFAIAPGGGEYDPTTFAASVQARITIAATGTPFSNGRNSVRAGGGKFDGTVSYDPPTVNDPNPTTWTADFPMSDLDAQLALGNKNFEGVFLSASASSRSAARRPGRAGARRPAADSVTSFDRSVVNASNIASPLTVERRRRAGRDERLRGRQRHEGQQGDDPGRRPVRRVVHDRRAGRPRSGGRHADRDADVHGDRGSRTSWAPP